MIFSMYPKICQLENEYLSKDFENYQNCNNAYVEHGSDFSAIIFSISK